MAVLFAGPDLRCREGDLVWLDAVRYIWEWMRLIQQRMCEGSGEFIRNRWIRDVIIEMACEYHFVRLLY